MQSTVYMGVQVVQAGLVAHRLLRTFWSREADDGLQAGGGEPPFGLPVDLEPPQEEPPVPPVNLSEEARKALTWMPAYSRTPLMQALHSAEDSARKANQARDESLREHAKQLEEAEARVSAALEEAERATTMAAKAAEEADASRRHLLQRVEDAEMTAEAAEVRAAGFFARMDAMLLADGTVGGPVVATLPVPEGPATGPPAPRPPLVPGICCVCMGDDRPCEVVFSGCGHMTTCLHCAQALLTRASLNARATAVPCPLCRTRSNPVLVRVG